MKGVWRQRNTGCILALIMSRMMVMMIWSHHYQHQTGRALRQKTGGEHPKSSYVSSSCAGLPRPPACARLPRPPPSAYMRLHWAACGVEERGGAGGAAQPAGAKESSASTEAATEVGAGLPAKDSAITGRYPPKGAKQGSSGRRTSRRRSIATRRQRPPTGAVCPRGKRSFTSPSISARRWKP